MFLITELPDYGGKTYLEAVESDARSIAEDLNHEALEAFLQKHPGALAARDFRGASPMLMDILARPRDSNPAFYKTLQVLRDAGVTPQGAVQKVTGKSSTTQKLLDYLNAWEQSVQPQPSHVIHTVTHRRPHSSASVIRKRQEETTRHRRDEDRRHTTGRLF